MKRSGLTTTAFGLVALLTACSERDVAKHRNALWHVVNTLCVPDIKLTGLPAPCAAVDRIGGVAILKDVGHTGYLVVPTRRLTGIEDPRLIGGNVPNYWALAWRARSYVEAALGRPLPPNAVGIAVNARSGRTQDQLHFHIDCVRVDVQRTLDKLNLPISSGWLTSQLRGHTYRLRHIDAAEFTRDPFRSVALNGPDGARLSELAVAVLGSKPVGNQESYIIAVEKTDARHDGHAEELLDHTCQDS